MANECAPGECENDPKYTTAIVLNPYPGGSEGGHEFVTELPETGTPGVEYIVLTDITDCDSFEGSWAWNTEADCWVQTSGSGGGDGATYSFEETDTGWRAKKNDVVIFAYNTPIATTSTLGGVVVGDNLTVDENGRVSGDYQPATNNSYGLVKVDTTLSQSSTNPVTNAAVYAAIGDVENILVAING